MRYLPLSFLLLLLPATQLLSQTIRDAVRYSFLETGGTARTVGIGGAVGALGADFSVLSTNPAGLAAFRRSEFTFTPTLVHSATRETLEGGSNPDVNKNRLNLNFNNIGLVISSRPLSANWTVSALGFGLNRTAHFFQRSYFEGRSAGSITDRWLEMAQGNTPDALEGFEAGPAFDAAAIFRPDPDNFPADYSSDFAEGAEVDKSQRVEQKGAVNEMVLSYAGNYRDRLLIGMTVGLPLLSFEETRTYRETDENNEIEYFEDLTYTERLRTTGAGINLKAGMILRVSQAIRLGAAVHTPTAYGLDEAFSTQVQYNYLLNGIVQNGEALSPEGSFQYRLRSPWRFSGSAGFIFGRNGFISAEAELVDYTGAKFNFNQTSSPEDLEYERELNAQIKDELTRALNLRLGGEFAWERFRVRGGYALMAAPYLEGADPFHLLSMGAGIRGEQVFLDMAFQRQVSQRRYAPYLTSQAPESSVLSERTRNTLMATMGIKF
jgi:hypothetical protein